MRAERHEPAEHVAACGPDWRRESDQALPGDVRRQLRPGAVAPQRPHRDRVRHHRRRNLLLRQRATHDVRPVERVEPEKHHIRRRGLLDRLRQRVVDCVGGDERSLRRLAGRGPERDPDRHVELVHALVDPGALRLVAGERVGDQRAARQIDVRLRGIVGAGDQDAPVVRHEHPRGSEEVPVFLGLIEHVGALGALQQLLAELGDLGTYLAHPRERGRPRGQIRLHAAPHPRQGAPDRFVGGAVRLQRSQPERHAEHCHHEQRRGEEDPGGEPKRYDPSSARLRHWSGSPVRTCSCGASSGSRARRAGRRGGSCPPRRP